MRPKIIKKEAFLIAGVAGSGDETGKVWETYMNLEKVSPLKNQVGEVGYEIRMHPDEGPGKIFVGVQVKDASFPKEYQVFYLPAATYAEFEIFPAKGYESSNGVMSKWLEDNATTYKPAILDGMHYGVEVYDKRFKGNDNPESVVGFWEPIVPVSREFNPAQFILGPLSEICGRIEEFAGADIGKKVTEGKDEMLASKDPVKGSLWMKKTIDRLDASTTPEKCKQIMTACGKSCNAHNHKDSDELKQMRDFCATEEEFLETFIEPPGNGAYTERKGNLIIQRYTPRKYKKGLRCYCSLINSLPKDVNASPTYCQCSRAFVQAHWEAVLGRPLKVELGKTAITGSDECEFIIHL